MAYESYIAGYWRRQEELERHREEERQRILEQIRDLTGYFDGLPRLQRVYLFGSIAAADSFRLDSDVDLAFEGLPAELFCSVLSEIVERLQRDVDALRLEDAPEALKERILKGEILYERRPCPHS
ncbi:MAG: nucleotidyltransferase domain-containing protein [Planctomycetes bacterium]|nr:nucleotidyltransferase domain-containing protein [Planctomycetota bacterium]